MQFSIIALLSIAGMAAAAPTATYLKAPAAPTAIYLKARSLQPLSERSISERSIREVSNHCNTQQVVSCCNQNVSNHGNSPLGGLLGGGLLNLNCAAVSVNILSTSNAPANQVCGNNAVACCSGNSQTGHIDDGADCQKV